MKTLYDVQQLLEKYGILVHIGKRIWDIELMALELDNINKAGLIDQHDYMMAKLILRREYRIEELNEKRKIRKQQQVNQFSGIIIFVNFYERADQILCRVF